MKRNLEKSLIQWKDSDYRKPLLLRGARQVGKSFFIEDFGRRHFEHCITINFELQPECQSYFDHLNPEHIIKQINLHQHETIQPCRTLLFLDEIQDCPQALMALRYFKEKLPELHVIAAGSLLEFTLHGEDLRMPVGRYQSLFLKPLSFKEFLTALEHEPLVEFIETIHKGDFISEAVHQQLLELVRDYMAIGGMPEVVWAYKQGASLEEVQNLQTQIYQAYPNDFGKYKARVKYQVLHDAYRKLPEVACLPFKYVSMSREHRAMDLKSAIDCLDLADIVTLIKAASGQNIPLNATTNPKKFKLAFLDIGLLKRASNRQLSELMRHNTACINQGQFAEQYVAQTLQTLGDPSLESELFYWVREAKSSTAEVDFLIQVNHEIIPIEVKSSHVGHLKSLKLFMQTHHSSIGFRVSEKPFGLEGDIMSLPFYLLSEIYRLTEELNS